MAGNENLLPGLGIQSPGQLVDQRWAVLKRGEADRLTTVQFKAMSELLAQGLDTAPAVLRST
jgi:hypothetical protein